MNAKVTICAAGALLLLAFAAVRIGPFVRGAPGPVKADAHRQIERTLSGPLVASPKVRFDDDRDGYLAAHRRDVVASLSTLVNSGEMTRRDAEAIAARVSGYLSVCTFGDLDAYRAYAIEMGRDPILPSNLTDETGDRHWLLRTSWAKHQPLSFDAAESRMIFTRGQLRNDFASFVGGPVRPLRTGGDIFSGDVRCSIVEITTSAALLTMDGDEAVPARIGFLVANDGPGGVWDTHMVFTRDVPSDKIVAMPPP